MARVENPRYYPGMAPEKVQWTHNENVHPGWAERRTYRGGYEIRTREGVNPTRFPSERHRPLGESSIEQSTWTWCVAPIRPRIVVC